MICMKIENIKYSSLESWAAQYIIDRQKQHSAYFPYVSLRNLLQRSKEKIEIDSKTQYRQVTVRTNFMGVSLRNIKLGEKIKTKTQYVIQEGQLLISKIDVRNGACALVPQELSGAIITANFWTFNINVSIVRPNFILAFFSTRCFLDFAERSSNGSTGRHYLQEDAFLNFSVPLPSLTEQDKMLKQYDEIISKWRNLSSQRLLQEKNTWCYVQHKLGIGNHMFKCSESMSEPIVFRFSDMQSWNVNDINFFQRFNSNLFPTHTLIEQISSIKLLTRGKSPKYLSSSTTIIINQRCIRRGYVDVQYAKRIDSEWASKKSQELLTRKGDILICSTGNGTIGRAALIDSESEGLLCDSHVILLRLDDKQISPILLCYIINSIYGQEQIDYLKTARTTNQTELGITNLLKIKIPSLPIKKQNQLAAKIKKSSKDARGAKNDYTEAVLKAAQLLETLLYE